MQFQKRSLEPVSRCIGSWGRACYEACLEFELLQRGFAVKRQLLLPIRYNGNLVDNGFRLDLLVNDSVIVELKATEKFERIHEVQLLTYLKLTKIHLGLLMNFNTIKLVDGIKRIVRDFPE